MIIKKEDRDKHLSSYDTSDCSVRDKNIFYFVLRENYTSQPNSQSDVEADSEPAEGDLKKRILVWMRAKPESEQWSRSELTGLERQMFGGCCTKPKPQFVGIAGADVYSIGSGESGYEKDIPDLDHGGPFQGSAEKTRNINGWLYATGGGHCVGKRVARDEWQSFSKKIPRPSNKGGKTHMFHDIDGFSESDIYCVGSYGIVCHFDGKDWVLKTMPTNINFQSVCCAGDGYVYLSGLHGATYKGRGDEWKCLYKGHLENKPLPKMSLGFKDMVWYEDRVWCTSDYGIWTIKDDKLEEADVPYFVQNCMGNLSTADGVLLIAGYAGASFLENGKWQQIY